MPPKPFMAKAKKMRMDRSEGRCRESHILSLPIGIYGADAAGVGALTVGITGTVGDEEAGEGKASTGKTKD